MTEQDAYLSGLHHRDLYGSDQIGESFRGVEPAFRDDFVSIYRLGDLRQSCPEELSARHLFTSAYAGALQKISIIDERHGNILIFPSTPEVGEHFMRYLRHFAQVDKNVLTIVSDEQANIDIQSSKSQYSDSYVDLERNNAVWLVNERLEFDIKPSVENQAWFLARFQFCQRFHEDERTTIDLYHKLDIPCSAMDERSAVEAHYEDGVRLHNASFDVYSDEVRYYLAWTNDTKKQYAFSIQFFDEDGHKALQYDNVILRELLEVHAIDTTPIPEGVYSVKLIVYDFVTQISQSGTVTDLAERFERELDVAWIEVQR